MTFRKTANNLNTPIILMVLGVVFLTVIITDNISAKSLYIIADKGILGDPTQPVQAYDIGADGTLAFQTQCDIPHAMLGAVGMAIDSDAGYLFITYDLSNDIHIVDAQTMTNADTYRLESDDADPAGIVYDHKKKRLYCAEVGSKILHVFDWEPETLTLAPVPNSPFTLKKTSTYGIALDEVNDRLFTANASNTIHVYSTSDWSLLDSIELNRIAISIAVDVRNEFIYTGGGFLDNYYLTQYHLATGTKREVQVELDAGVIGLGVDPDTDRIYVSTGRDNQPGGDNLLAFDISLTQVDLIPSIGNPTGLAIPEGDVGYNPLNLSLTIIEGTSNSSDTDDIAKVVAGGTLTYAIHFENNNDFPINDVSVIDTLPDTLTFVTADSNEVKGQYDSKAHTYQWSFSSLPANSSTTLELTAKVIKNAQAGIEIVNTVKISSLEIAPTTKSVRVETTNNALNLSKFVSGQIEDQVSGIDPNEPVSYTIAFDNNDNDFNVTNITIVDFLPEEITFIRADEGKVSGKYDASEHTYTWSYPFIRPGETVTLEIETQVNKDTAPGTVITNLAMISSSETPSSMASVDTITYFNPLTLIANIDGDTDGELKWIAANEEMTYTIQIHNINNDSAVTNVSVVDRLPEQVNFIRARADDHGVTGRYDSKTHTYTWSYDALEPTKSPISLDLTVRVNKTVPAGEIISNSVTVDSDQTRPTTVSVDAKTYYQSLSLSTVVIGSVIGETEWVDVNETYTYQIYFNNNNDIPVTDVFIVDTLPKEIQFESADGDGDFGWYDSKTHTYTWSYPSLEPGSSAYLEITASVNPGTALSTTITNLVTIDSFETMPTTSSIEVIVGESPLEAQTFSILPGIIRDTSSTYEIQAMAILPPGIGKDDIKEVLPTLYPSRISAKRQIILGSPTRVKVIALFDKDELLEAVSDRGEVTLTVVGKLITGRTWYGTATVYITSYTGN